MSEQLPLYVFGGSGHGKVVAAAALASGQFDLRGFLDDATERHEQRLLGLSVQALDALDGSQGQLAIALGVGHNRDRLRLLGRLRDSGHSVVSVVHPSASLAVGASLGEGTYVGPQAVVHADARVGRACIVNSGAVVEHDGVLADGVHVSPNAALGGGVTLARGVQVGLCAAVLPNLTVGEWAVVGAGAVVTRDVPARVTVIGAPARSIPRETREPERE